MEIIKNKKLLFLISIFIIVVIIVVFAVSNRPAEVFSKSQNGYVDVTLQDGTIVTYSSYATYDDADKNTNLIIIGNVTKVNSPERLQDGEIEDPDTGKKTPHTGIYTMYEVKVDKVIKGNAKVGDTVRFGELSVQKNDTGYFKVNERRLFFLDYHDSGFQMSCATINPVQGSILIDKGKTVRSTEYQFINGSVPEEVLVKKIEERIKSLTAAQNDTSVHD